MSRLLNANNKSGRRVDRTTRALLLRTYLFLPTAKSRIPDIGFSKSLHRSSFFNRTHFTQ